MKLMIASDIHGSAYYCRKLLEAYDREKAGRMVILGDILYHGPRNDLPKEYAPKEVIAMLNPRKKDLLWMRVRDEKADLKDNLLFTIWSSISCSSGTSSFVP